MKYPVWFWLSIILIISGFLRVYRIDVKMRFIWDEARDMTAIHQMIVNRNLTLFGPFNEIDGKKDFFGVFHYYLMAPSLWLADFDPVGPAIFTALLGTLSVGLVYLVLRKWEVNQNVALITTLIYGFSPLVVRYQIWPWNPNTMAFFSLLFVLVISFKRQKWWMTFCAGLVLGLLFQLHYFTVPLGLYWVIWHLRNSRGAVLWRRFGLFLSGFILPTLSFGLFDLTHDFFYSRILLESFTPASGQQLFLTQGFNPLTVLFSHTLELVEGLSGLPITLSMLGSVLLIGLFGYELYSFWQTRRVTNRVIIVIIYMAHMVMISFLEGLWNIYHSAYLWWGIIWLIVSRVYDWWKDWTSHLTSFFIKLGLLSIGIWLILANDINREPLWSENMPLKRQAALLVAEDVKKEQWETFTVASLTDADTRATAYRYFLTVYELLPSPIDHYPQDTHLYLISMVEDLDQVMLDPPWELASFGESKRVLIGTVGDFYVYRFDKEG